jgi:hypothetical protein
METAARRKFTIADGMILIAASALTFVDLGLPYVGNSNWGFARRWLTWTALVLTIALVPVRLRRPHPGRDALWRQPGWVACASVTIAAVVLVLDRALWSGQGMVRSNRLDLHLIALYFTRALDNLPLQTTMVISAAWGVLALAGRWEAEPGWIDRAGRAVGISWFAVSLADWGFRWFT